MRIKSYFREGKIEDNESKLKSIKFEIKHVKQLIDIAVFFGSYEEIMKDKNDVEYIKNTINYNKKRCEDMINKNKSFVKKRWLTKEDAKKYNEKFKEELKNIEELENNIFNKNYSKANQVDMETVIKISEIEKLENLI